jgi:hypothetical protein
MSGASLFNELEVPGVMAVSTEKDCGPRPGQALKRFRECVSTTVFDPDADHLIRDGGAGPESCSEPVVEADRFVELAGLPAGGSGEEGSSRLLGLGISDCRNVRTQSERRGDSAE